MGKTTKARFGVDAAGLSVTCLSRCVSGRPEEHVGEEAAGVLRADCLHPEGARCARGHYRERAVATVCAQHRRHAWLRRWPAAQPREVGNGGVGVYDARHFKRNEESPSAQVWLGR